MRLEDYLKDIESFLINYLKNSPCKAYVLGLSGGVDSTLVAAIARKAVGKNNLFCYAISVDSNKADIDDAIKVAKELDLNLKVLDLSSTYHEFIKNLDKSEILKLTASNLKVRLRMCALYAYAQENNALVLGTDNADERYVGYFTKYGDGAVDILPIVHLTKHEVIQAAKFYGVSEDLYNRIPSAGLFEGQTDESEMGLKYSDLDAYLLGNKINSNIIERIEHLHKISEHKRNAIPEMAPFNRK